MDREPITTAQRTTDEVLLRRFSKGDRGALGELASRYERPLIGLARGLLGQREDLALEAVQDAWVRVIKSAGHFDFRSSVKTWLYRIVINRCHDLRAAQTRGGFGGSAAVAERAASEPWGAQESEPLLRALAALPGDRRLLLLLCYHAGMSHPQAAEVLGIATGTLKSRLSAALAELRGLLADEREP